MPRQWLSWHYRSQDESLIAFSNAQYYENRLSSFPAPTHGRASSEPDGRGVSLVRVPGTFHRSGAGRLLRTNPIEAKAIVAEIRRRFDLVPKWDGIDVVPSIGVVTFNAQQRAYIESLLRDADDDRLAAALDRTDGEGLFVKNLENVQGDERDVVFFSTGFSVNAAGTLPLNFGPLNRAGGERRLNVAITRARRQVVVFSSFDPEQLRAEETSSVGIKHLRAYLDLAAQGTDVLPRDARSTSVVDRHRESIAAALRERGLVVRTDVGLSEFRVDLSVSRPVDPETPVMAVLLDGPAWARRGTVGDRDGLPVEVLGEMLRWPVVERVWLPSWLASCLRRRGPAGGGGRRGARVAPVAEPIALPTAAVESFKGVAALRSSVTASVAVPAAAPRAAAKPRRAEKPAGPAALDGETPFVPWIPKTAGEKSVLDELPAAKAARVVRRVLAAGIKAEGPIHVDRLAKLTVGAFGLNRATEARKEALLSTLPPSAVVDGYLWPEGVDPASWTGFRRQVSSTDRPLEHVAPEEIGNAMAALCRAGPGMRRDELLTQTAAVFGYKRRAAAVTPVLEAALKLALRPRPAHRAAARACSPSERLRSLEDLAARPDDQAVERRTPLGRGVRLLGLRRLDQGVAVHRAGPGEVRQHLPRRCRTAEQRRDAQGDGVGDGERDRGARQRTATFQDLLDLAQDLGISGGRRCPAVDQHDKPLCWTSTTFLQDIGRIAGGT